MALKADFVNTFFLITMLYGPVRCIHENNRTIRPVSILDTYFGGYLQKSGLGVAFQTNRCTGPTNDANNRNEFSKFPDCSIKYFKKRFAVHVVLVLVTVFIFSHK